MSQDERGKFLLEMQTDYLDSSLKIPFVITPERQDMQLIKALVEQSSNNF